MAVKRKHTKNLGAVRDRIAVLRREIQERNEELGELAQHLADFEFSISFELREIKDEFGISPSGWAI